MEKSPDTVLWHIRRRVLFTLNNWCCVGSLCGRYVFERELRSPGGVRQRAVRPAGSLPPGSDPHVRHGDQRALPRALPRSGPREPHPDAALQRAQNQEHARAQPRRYPQPIHSLIIRILEHYASNFRRVKLER